MTLIYKIFDKKNCLEDEINYLGNREKWPNKIIIYVYVEEVY